MILLVYRSGRVSLISFEQLLSSMKVKKREREREREKMVMEMEMEMEINITDVAHHSNDYRNSSPQDRKRL